MEDRKSFLKLSSEDVNNEMKEIKYNLGFLSKTFNLDSLITNPKVIKTVKDTMIEKIEKHNDYVDQENAISGKGKDAAYDDNAQRIADDLAFRIIRDKNKTWLPWLEEQHPLLKCRQTVRYIIKSVFALMARESMLTFYQKNMLDQSEDIYLRARTESTAKSKLNYFDNNYWKVGFANDDSELDVKATEIESYSFTYKVFLKKDWCTKVFDKDLWLTDIAGKDVFVMDANEIEVENPTIAGLTMLKIKVGYAIKPIDGRADYYKIQHLSKEKKNEIRQSTAYCEDKYLCYILDTDGKRILATGKDPDWAQRTLRMRLKRTMLKTMDLI